MAIKKKIKEKKELITNYQIVNLLDICSYARLYFTCKNVSYEIASTWKYAEKILISFFLRRPITAGIITRIKSLVSPFIPRYFSGRTNRVVAKPRTSCSSQESTLGGLELIPSSSLLRARQTKRHARLLTMLVSHTFRTRTYVLKTMRSLESL